MISDATLRRVLPKSTVDLVGDLVRGLLWGLVLVIWLTFIQIYVRMWRLAYSDPESDFTIFYYTARLVADGFPMYGASPARYGIHWAADHLGNLNPPHFQLLLHPLASLSYSQAFVVWGSLTLAALAVAILLIVNGLGMRVSWSRALAAGALLISSAAFTTVVVTWELTFLLMVPFTLAWMAARRGRWAAAGAWLGVCASIKLFFLLFVLWLVLQRRWRALAGAAASGAACVSAGAAAYGAHTYVDWLRNLGIVGWEWIHMNASWPGLVARVLRGKEEIMAPVWVAPSFERTVSVMGSGLVCAVALLAAAFAAGGGALPRRSSFREGGRPSLSEPTRQDLSWLLLLLAAILASPLGWVYYLPLALGPLLGVIRSGMWKQLPRGALLAVGMAAAGLWVPQEVAASRQPSAVATVTLASSYFWATAALWIGTVFLAYRHSSFFLSPLSSTTSTHV